MAPLRPSERRFWRRFMVWLALGYLAVCALAWLAADSMLFVPQYGTRADPPGVVPIELDDGTRLAAVYLPNPGARFTLWYFHGNAEALADILPRLNELREFGFSVFALEYPGYGVSGGSPGERQIYASLPAGLAFLRTQNVSPDRIVVYGRSIGGGSAVELASREPVAGLILESAFMSAYRVMTRWPILLGDKFNNLRKMAGVQCPVLVIHGRNDRIIPFYHGEALHAAAPAGRKQFLRVDSAGHNDLREWTGETYRAALAEFISKL